MNEPHLTPGEVSDKHTDLLWAARRTREHAEWYANNPDVDLELLDISVNVEGAESRVREFAERNAEALYVAALAEAALSGVQVNHPDALKIS